MVRLIALDLDGTLLTSDGRITQASKDAIARARAKNIRVVLATGRSCAEVIDFSHQAGCDVLGAALGGAALVDTKTEQALRTWAIPEGSDRKALELCLGRQIELMIFARDQILVDPFSKESLLRTFPCQVFHDAAIVTQDPIAYMEEHQLPLLKIHGDQNPGSYPLEELSALPGVSLTRSNDHDFELVRQGVDKGSTLALLSLLFGIPLEDCAAIGDSDNDLAMLQAAGFPVAMGNGCAAVREAAQYVTVDNDHDGVARAIEYLLDYNEKNNPLTNFQI